MQFRDGASLGPYQIVAPIGAGGMGEVYRARDSKLGREVAIKVLPAAFAQDTERMARFQREAQTLAVLNHPNIAAVYGLEGAALVMEYVPGDSPRGPLPVEEAVAIARQIVEALEYAHDKGIIHRDLKPANIRVTPDGKVKVLDFGLAKALEDAPQDLSYSPTLSIAATRAGVILGTAAYMSPEQAKGRPADRRADIWSFGVVLLELLTGRQAFEGESASEVMAAVMLKEPVWPQGLPPALERLLRRCLTKDPRQRLQSIGEARIALETPLDIAPSPAAPIPQSAIRNPQLPWLLTAAMALVVVALAVRLFVWPSRPPARVAHLTLALDPAERLGSGFTFSPDGRRLVFAGRAGGKTQLYLRDLDQRQAMPLDGTTDAVNPFFSPDGQWIGFESSGKLQKTSVNGGAATALSYAFSAGGVWTPSDQIIFPFSSAGTKMQLASLPAQGGTPKLLPGTESQAGGYQAFPHLLPGGKYVLFTAQTGQDNWEGLCVDLISVDGKDHRTLIKGGSNAEYAPSGHLVFIRETSLMAAPFDLKSLTVTGPPVKVLGPVRSFDLSVDGSLAYWSAGGFSTGKGGVGEVVPPALVWVDLTGKSSAMGAPPHDYAEPRLSRDGRLLSVDSGNDVWVYESGRQALTRITFDPLEDETGVFSPDGKWVAYSASRKDKPRLILRKASDGSGTEEELWRSEHHLHVESWSTDGKFIAFVDRDPQTGDDIWVLSLEGNKPSARVLLNTRARETQPRLSPDGRWIAYVSDESGRSEVYIQSFPSLSGKWQISNAGGQQPLWSADSRQLFYRGGGQAMAVSVTPGAGFQAGPPRILFADRFNYPGDPIHSWWAVAPDGKRFVMIEDPEAARRGTDQLNVVLNWVEELRRLK